MSGAGSPAGVIEPGRPMRIPGFAAKHPALWRELVTVGRRTRVGHDRETWAEVDWDQLRAQVGLGRRAGPWQVRAVRCGVDGACLAMRRRGQSIDRAGVFDQLDDATSDDVGKTS